MIIFFRRLWHLLNRSEYEREVVREMSEHRDSMHDPSKFSGSVVAGVPSASQQSG